MEICDLHHRPSSRVRMMVSRTLRASAFSSLVRNTWVCSFRRPDARSRGRLTEVVVPAISHLLRKEQKGTRQQLKTTTWSGFGGGGVTQRLSVKRSACNPRVVISIPTIVPFSKVLKTEMGGVRVRVFPWCVGTTMSKLLQTYLYLCHDHSRCSMDHSFYRPHW